MKYVKNVFIGNALFLTIITIIDLIVGKYEYFFLLFLSLIYLIIACNVEKAYTKFTNPKLLKLQLTFLSILSIICICTPFLDSKGESPIWLNIIFAVVIVCTILIIIVSTIQNMKTIQKKSNSEYEKKFMQSIIIVVAVVCGVGIAYIINSVLK